MISRALVGFTLLAAAAAPAAAEGFTSSREKPGYELVKEWDFGVNCNDLRCVQANFYTRYGYDAGRQDFLPKNGEWQRYRMRDNHRIEGGALMLVARETDGWRNGGFESGLIRSKFVQKYGYFEARIRLPKGRGLWSTFELLPASAVWPPAITVMTAVDNRPDARKTSYHFLTPSRDGENGGKTKLDRWGGYAASVDLADEFHVYAVEWTPNRVIHYVDGTVVADRPFRWTRQDGKDAGPAEMVIHLAVGGDWAGPPMEPSDFPAALAIDYIRIYRQHDTGAISQLPQR
jgi:beta-glucanase (GH16 family)